MAESHRSGGRTDVVHSGDAGASGTRRHDPARELTPEEPTGGLLRDLSTRRGPARIRIDAAGGEPRALFVLGHGAGGSIDAPDLEAVTAALVPHGVTVVRVTQPYRVAGRKAPPPANHLDEAWLDVVRAVVASSTELPLVVGGRSSGARVACRTAAELGAAGVVALAFPTHPPGKPERSRVDELPLDRPTLVLNGDRDPFGVPSVVGQVTLHVLPGADHSLKRAADEAAIRVTEWFKAHEWAN